MALTRMPEPPSPDDDPAPAPSRLHEARRIIEREFATPLTAQRLARRVRLPPLAFHHGFKTAFGQTMEAYLRAWRMQQAAALLAAGHDVPDVALLVGYTRYRRFVMDYRRVFRDDAERLRLLAFPSGS